jgi:hypothetical protein
MEVVDDSDIAAHDSQEEAKKAAESGNSLVECDHTDGPAACVDDADQIQKETKDKTGDMDLDARLKIKEPAAVEHAEKGK